MKKTKKFMSILISFSLLLSAIFTSNIVSYAYDTVYDLKFNTYHYGRIIPDMANDGYNEIISKDFYKFSLSNTTTLYIDYEAVEDATNGRPNIEIIKASDYHNYTSGKSVGKYLSAIVDRSEQKPENVYYSGSVTLNTGEYYLVILSGFWYGGHAIGQNYSLKVIPTVSSVKNLKSTSTTNSIKLTWSGNIDAVGYQVQKSTSDGYKTVKTTTGTSCTFKDLSSAYTYKYRVRGYTKVNGKTYYGSWKTITAVTKPSKVSIKTPTTNSKHQIIAKWNKVTRATGYQVQYCKNKSCSSVIATKTVSGQSKVSYTGKNFTKGKIYYVRVRAYKTVNGTKYYGAWSSVKSIKCK